MTALRDFTCRKLSEALHKERTVENLDVVLLPLKHRRRRISGIEGCAYPDDEQANSGGS